MWARAAAPGRRPEGRIAVGFDGSHSRDGTALIGCTSDGFVWPILILERPANAPDGWRIDRDEVHRALEQTMIGYNVAAVYCDPWRWQDELDDWAERWGDKVLSFPTNSTQRMAPAVDRFRSALEERRVMHSGDPNLTRHMLNARLRKTGRAEDGRGTYLLEKAGPGRLIDGCVAAMLAYEAASHAGVEACVLV